MSTEIQGAGAMLAALREQKGLTLEQVAQRLRFAQRQIDALETGRYDALPDMTFVRGLVRSYARLLDADPAAFLSCLELERQDARLIEVPVAPPKGAPRDLVSFSELPATARPWLIGAGGALIVALVLALLWWRSASAPVEPIPVVTTPALPALPQPPSNAVTEIPLGADGTQPETIFPLRSDPAQSAASQEGRGPQPLPISGAVQGSPQSQSQSPGQPSAQPPTPMVSHHPQKMAPAVPPRESFREHSVVHPAHSAPDGLNP